MRKPVKKPAQRRARSILLLAACILPALSLLSCATAGGAAPAHVTECPERLFWRIDGSDRRGNPSTVYVQGTVHLGDERMYPLEDSVVAAWERADRLVAEIGTEDYEQLPAKVSAMWGDSYRKAAGRVVTDGLSGAQKETLARYLDGELLEAFALFEPWVTAYSLAAALYADSDLSPEYGLDNLLLALAREEGRTVESLDTLQVQLDSMSYGNYDEQMEMLRDLLDELKDPSAAVGMVQDLYEAYLADDRAAVNAINQGEQDEDMARHAFYEGYYKMLMSDRNEDWAKDIAGYLRKGGTTFIFAGAAHWVGDDSVFVHLRRMGAAD